MQLVIKLTSGSLPTYKLRLQRMVASAHVETIGRGQIFIEDCKCFCKDRKRERYIYIYDICSFLTFTAWAGWQSSYFLKTKPPHSPHNSTIFFFSLLPVRIKRHAGHRHLQSSIRVPRQTWKNWQVWRKKKVFVFWWKVLLLKIMCRLSHVQCIG